MKHIHTKKLTYRCLVACLGALLFCAATGQAQTTNSYTNSVTANWTVTSSWSLGHLPTSSEVVLVASNQVNINTAAVASNVVIGGSTNGAIQFITTGANSLTVGGNITLAPGAGNGTLVLQGTNTTLTLNGGAGSIVDGGGAGNGNITVQGNFSGSLGLVSATVANINMGQSVGTGTLIINAGQTYNVADNIRLNNNGVAGSMATITINGGTLNLGDDLGNGETHAGILRFNSAGGTTNQAFVNLNGGGTLKAESLQRNNVGTDVALNWNDGTIQNHSGNNLTISCTTNGYTLNLYLAGTGTHTFEADSGRTITVQSTAVLADKAGENGTLVKTGLGTLLFNGTNTYSGGTTISAGTLALGAAARLTNTVSIAVASNATFDVSAVTGGFTLQAGQTLTGNGLVKGATTIASNAVISPGLNGIGTLTFSNNLTFAGTWNVALTNDTINVLNIIGSLSVSSGAVLDFDITGAQTLNQYAFGIYSNALGAATNNFFLQNLGPGYSVQYDISLGGNRYEMAVVIPEPSSSALVAGGLCLLLAFQCRRRRP